MSTSRSRWAVGVLAGLLGIAGVSHAGWAPAEPAKSQPESTSEPIAGFPRATLTLFPVAYDFVGPIEQHRAFYDRLMGPPGQQQMATVVDTLTLLLEEQGYNRFTVTKQPVRFAPGNAERERRAAVFSTVVRGLELESDYALCTQFIMHIERGTVEVYSAIARADGTVVWEDVQQPGDPDFDANFPGTPTKCMSLVVRRLTPAMALDELPKKPLSVEKAAALRQIRAEEPPDQAEFAAMEARLKAFCRHAGDTTLAVYPTRLGGEQTDAASVGRLLAMLNDEALCRASAAAPELRLAGSGWPNEMKVLWLYAREVRAYLRDHPPESDYVLFADYWLRPHDDAVHAVHFVVCDKAGDWVIVDMQNSHHPDFQQISPKTLADCDRLVVRRLESYVR